MTLIFLVMKTNQINHKIQRIKTLYTLKEQTLAIQHPTKSHYCNQQVPFFDLPFFKYKRNFHYFFLSEDTQITIETIKSQQKQDPVIQKVYHWLKTNERPLQIDPTIASNSFLSVHYKLFNQLYINHDTKIIHIDYPNLHHSNPNQKDKICSPFKLFHAAFNKLHANGQSGIKISIKAFNQFCFVVFTIVLNVNKANTVIKKFKLHWYKHFQKMLRIPTTEYQWIQKVL